MSETVERGDPMLVGVQMQRLARLAHRVVWVNPRVSASGFSVRASGMVAALPHCDALVSGHSFEALTEVVEAIETTSGRTGRPIAALPPVEAGTAGDSSGQRHSGPGQLRRDAERSRAEQGQRDSGVGDRHMTATAKTCIYPGCERPAVPAHPQGRAAARVLRPGRTMR